MTLQGFNGAATLSLRKYPGNADNVGYLILLQWGRNFIVAEIYRGSCCRGRVTTASMGPQLYRCGNDLGAGLGVESHKCFNGAATLSLRKYYEADNGSNQTHDASMGPQLYRCGNIMRPTMAPIRPMMLQWGRNFIVAEMPPWDR